MEAARSRHLDSAQLEQRGHEVHVAGQGVDVAPADDVPVGVADQEGHAVAAFVLGALAAAHAGVVAARPLAGELTVIQLDPRGRAVVGHEDEDRIVGDTQVVEGGSQTAEVLVDVGDHAVEAAARSSCGVVARYGST